MIYEEMFRSSQAITLQTHRIRLNRYYNCFLGNELVNWLISQQKATTRYNLSIMFYFISTDLNIKISHLKIIFIRVHASALGQALFEAGFIESVLMDSAFSDSASLFRPAKLSRVQSKDYSSNKQATCDAQEPAWVKTIPQHDSTTGNLNVIIETALKSLRC